MKRPADWPLSHRRPVVVATALLVTAAAGSVYLRTEANTADPDFGVYDALILAGFAAVSLSFVAASRRWRIWFWQCVLATLAWVMFLGPLGDLSCVDCGFALLIPLNVALGQVVLWLLGLLVSDLRRRPAPD